MPLPISLTCNSANKIWAWSMGMLSEEKRFWRSSECRAIHCSQCWASWKNVL